MLFFAGTRNSLCDLGLLRKVLMLLKTDWELEIIEGGDHSFRMLKSANISQREAHDHILRKMVDWLDARII